MPSLWASKVSRGVYLGSVEEDAAAIPAIGTRQTFDERRFAGAVLTEQRVDLAAPQMQIDLVERLCAGEALFDPDG